MAARGVLADESEESLSYYSIVQDSGAVVCNFICGCFCNPEHSPDTFSVAIIACVNSRALVCFPAWGLLEKEGQ